MLAAKVTAFTHYLEHAADIKSVLEFGGNIGMNERAMSIILPGVFMEVVEINEKAAAECSKIPNVTVHQGSILDFTIDKKFDLTFTSGCLIHINPDMLPVKYNELRLIDYGFIYGRALSYPVEDDITYFLMEKPS